VTSRTIFTVLFAVALVLAGCTFQGTRLFELTEGDCFNDQFMDPEEQSLILRVELVACDQPHQKEVTAIVPVEGGAEYPGREALVDVIASECEEALTSYADNDTEGVTATGQFPSTNSWDLGYHWVICIAESADGTLLEGSIRESSPAE